MQGQARTRAGTLKHLLDLTVETDDPGRVIDAAAAICRHQLALVDASGAELACAPGAGAARERALAVGRSAARTRVVPPRGWDIVRIGGGDGVLAILVVGTDGPDDAETRRVLDLLPTMLAGQLRRSLLAALQRAEFVRRLVSGPPAVVHQARKEAGALGVVLAESYWPAILGTHGRALAIPMIERVEQGLHGLVSGSLSAARSGQLALMYPVTDGVSRAEAAAWFRRAADQARLLAPSARPQVVAAEHPVELGALSSQVALLEALQRLPPRAGGERPLTWAGEYALDRLLRCTVAPERAASFVDEELGSLVRWDEHHHGDLLRVLEAALDFPRHDEAARHCFMHRNTFRHHLRLAMNVLPGNLETPERRLAVHVALKLRHLTASPEPGNLPVDTPPASEHPRARGRRLLASGRPARPRATRAG